ncbi:MAG: DNA topoisomerase 3 [Thiomicrorhabdus sp.]|nr:DNA topoisomerase 3 [Thiomicrorhabdus sp.]
MKMYIAEKKSLGEKVAVALGGGKHTNGYIDGGAWRVYFCRGHILKMFEPKDYNPQWEKWNNDDLPMIPDRWKLKPEDSTKHLLKLIGHGLKTATMAVNVGDADREGQLIVDEVLEYHQWQGNTKRLWFSDQSQQYISKNIDNLEDNGNAKYTGLRNQALARGRADWLIGLNSTRSYTLNARRKGADELLSVGRVQTPTLALIVNRDLEIENFVSRSFYELVGDFSHEDGDYQGKLIIHDSLKNEHGYFIDKECADTLTSSINGEAVIKDLEQKTKKNKQPLCFSKSDLVEQCFKQFGYDGDKVLEIAQSLYDKHEATTYPRTDCGYLPESDHEKALIIFKNLSGIYSYDDMIKGADASIKSATWNDEKLTAHDGIRPTESVTADTYSKMSQDEKNLFGVVVTRYLAQFYPVRTSNETTFITQVEDHQFMTKGTVINDKGWTVLYPEKKKKDQTLPAVSNDDNVIINIVDRVDKKTTPPKHFNDGNIENAMKNIARYVDDEESKKLLGDNEGIGEESTRSNIIKLLKKREYIQTKGKNLVSMPFGRALISSVQGTIKSPVKTAMMERKLKDIEQGKLSVDDYVLSQVEYTREIIDAANQATFDDLPKKADDENAVKCPKCDEGVLLLRKGKYGEFYSCSAYKRGCKANYKVLGKKPYIDLFVCDCDNGKLMLREGKFGLYFKCNSCDKNTKCERNKPKFDTFLENIKCPKCESALFIRESKKKKKHFPCSSKECEFVAFKGKSGYSYNENDTWHVIKRQ